MRKKNKVRFVCAVDSVYTLYLYLVNFQGNVEHTLFIISDGIPADITANLRCKIYVKSYKHMMFAGLRRLIAALKLKYIDLNGFISNSTVFYGQDHLFYSFAVIKDDFNLIEDGLANYVEHRTNFNKRVREFLLGGEEWGRSQKIKRIYLTGIADIPNDLIIKVTLIDLPMVWENKTQAEKNFIRVFFNFKLKNENTTHTAIFILLTQPFSEDGVITEQEKVNIYKNILSKYEANVVIKPHPREVTDYSFYFPENRILSASFPFQLLAMDLNKTNVITCFSSIKSDGINIFKHSYGTTMNYNLIKFYGAIEGTFDDFS